MLDERGLLAPSTRLSARLQDARLHGCRAFGELSGSLFGELSRAAEFTEDRAVVERRLSAAGREQAAGEARSRPKSLRCHSGARRNPVVETSHSRVAGMTTTGTTTERAIRQTLPSPHLPGPPSWIPAFAGMTTGAEVGLSLSRQLLLK